jgi:2'-5' RNA ligase
MENQTDFEPRLPLYFVALIPQGDVKVQINNIKHQTGGRFGCRQALKSPPHITIIPPFRLQPERVEEMLAAVRNHFEAPVNLSINFNGLGAFETRTIYLDIIADSGINAYDLAAKQLVSTQPDLFPNVRFHEAFHPHITLANRDIPPGDFREMMDYLGKKTYPVSCSELSLEILHLDRGRWITLL